MKFAVNILHNHLFKQKINKYVQQNKMLMYHSPFNMSDVSNDV